MLDDGIEIPLEFKARAGSRRITLKRNRIDPPSIIYPRGMTQAAALREISLHPAYVKLKEQMQRPVENAIEDGYRTRLHTFRFHPNQAGDRFAAYELGDEINVYVPFEQSPVSHAAQRFLFKVLKAVVKSEGERILPALVSQRARELGLSYKSVEVKPMVNSWGKCSSERRLIFSSALLLYPDRYVRLVVDHELTHLTYLDHGVEFWRLLSEYRGEDAEQENREMDRYRLAIPSVY